MSIFGAIVIEKYRQMSEEGSRPDAVIVSPYQHEELRQDFKKITLGLEPPEIIDRVCGLAVVISDQVNGFEVYEKGGNK